MVATGEGNVSGTEEESDGAGGGSNDTGVKVVGTGKGSDIDDADGRDSRTGERSDNGSDGYSGVGNNAAVRLSVKEEEMGDSDDVTVLGSTDPDTDHPFLVGLRNYLLSRHGKRRSTNEA